MHSLLTPRKQKQQTARGDDMEIVGAVAKAHSLETIYFLHHIGTVCIIAVASKDELQSDFREVGLLYRGEHGVHCAMNKAYTAYLPYLQEFEVDKL